MNVTDLFYTVFSVIFLEQNTRQIPHRFNQQHYQYNTNSDTTLIQDQGKQKTEDYTKVLITTGIGFGSATSSEVIDFSSESNSNCTNFVDFPVDTFGATGQMTNLPIICGGEGRDHPSVDACYIMTKDQTTPIASMMFNRSGAASVPVKDNSALWITGGQDGQSRQLLLATEIIDFTQNVSKLSIDLPLPLSGHCLIQISANTLFLIAGKSPDGPSSRTFYLHLDSTDWSSTGSGNWTEGPKLKHPRYLHSCGMQESSSKVIVSGGRNENDFEMDSVESLELQQQHSLEWIEGPRLPKPLASAAMVSIGADKLYVIGGIDNGDESFSSHIYELQNSGSSSQWSDFHRKLAVPRAGTVAIPIPDELALC